MHAIHGRPARLAAMCVLMIGAFPLQSSLAADPSVFSLLGNGSKSFSVILENDFLVSTDKDFTNLVRFDMTNTHRVGGNGPAKSLTTKTNRAYKVTAGFHFANNIYTGKDISKTPDMVDLNDRPYAGLLYLGFSKARVYQDESMTRWEVNLGCIGPCSRSEQIQKKVHTGNSRPPMGWPAQIRNDIVLQWYYDRHLPIKNWMKSPDKGKRRFDMSPSWHLEAGTIFNSVGLGLALRLGKIEDYYTGGGLSRPTPKKNSAPAAGSAGKERFLFVRAKARYMLRNATLQGGLFNRSSPFKQDIHHGVLDLEVGASIDLWGDCNLEMFLASRSTEVKAQDFDVRNHKWGGIRLSF